MLFMLIAFGVVGFIVITGIIGLTAIWSNDSTDKKRKKLYENLDGELDKIFNGSDTVTYKVQNLAATLKFEDVVTGATQRGYALTHQRDERYESTLIFTKTA